MNGNYIRGNVDTIILKCIACNGELYGGEIAKIINTASEGTYNLKKPTLYSALKRLESDKLVMVRDEESPIGGLRHYYSLTGSGKEFLSSKKFDWVYSKMLFDNLILDKKASVEDAFEKETKEPVVEEFRPERPAAQEPLYKTVAAQNIQQFMTDSALQSSISASVNIAVADTPAQPKLNEYITVPLYNAHQIAVDLNKVETMQIAPEQSLLKAFVKHSNERKSGKFVLYNRLRMVASMVVSILVVLGLTLSFKFLKSPNLYTNQESTFFMVGWIAVGVYFLANLVRYSAYP